MPVRGIRFLLRLTDSTYSTWSATPHWVGAHSASTSLTSANQLRFKKCFERAWAAWPCPQASKKQCEPVAHVTLTEGMPEELKKYSSEQLQETQNEVSCQRTDGLTGKQTLRA